MRINPYEVARITHAVLSDAEPTTLNLIPARQEFSNSLTIPFQDLLKKTNPQTPPEVITGILGIMSTLRFFMTYDLSEGSPMYLRGGTMREFLRAIPQYSNLNKNLWKNTVVEQNEDPFARQVVNHTFGPTDIDINLNYGGVLIQGEEVIRPDEALINTNIAHALEKIGWKKQGICLKLGNYLAQVSASPLCPNSSRLIHKVVFTQESNQSIVVEISFVDIPRTEKERAEDLRFLNNGLSIDVMTVGCIYIDEKDSKIYPKPITVTYERDIVDINLSLALLIFHAKQLFSLPLNNTKSIIERFRTITMMLSDPVAWVIPFGFKTVENNLKYWRGQFKLDSIELQQRKQTIRLFIASIKEQLPYIKENALPLLSDILFCFTSEPYLGLILTYYSGVLEIINLGEIINSEKRLIELMEKMTSQISKDSVLKESLAGLSASYHANSNPLVILDALKQFEFSDEEKQHLTSIGLYPEQIPRSVSGLLRFLVPRGLSLEDLTSL